MKGFVAVAEAFQDFQGILRRRFANLYRLETAFQSCILFNVFLVFLQGGGTDAAQFPSCQGRFHNVGCIHGAFAGTGTYQGVQFIYEENPVFVLLHFINDFFQSFLEFASVLGTCHHGGHIE